MTLVLLMAQLGMVLIVAMLPCWTQRAIHGAEEHMESKAWQGLTVRACDGRVVGGVVGAFADGPLWSGR